ncbi:MAG: hypothetical protein HRT86_08600 [Ilumatobacteraceae bacterium]|nr:hypothetical protein [Ilumatobacteraceae bacterium]
MSRLRDPTTWLVYGAVSAATTRRSSSSCKNVTMPPMCGVRTSMISSSPSGPVGATPSWLRQRLPRPIGSDSTSRDPSTSASMGDSPSITSSSSTSTAPT